MKNTFIIALFLFWIFVASVISAGYVVKQNRISQEKIQKEYTASIEEMQAIVSAAKEDAASVKSAGGEIPAVKNTTAATTSSVKKTTTKTSSAAPALTLATVASHSTEFDCWVVISGKVYSVTSYIPVHPGGAKKIISMCGKDATSAFGGIEGGRGHSGYAKSLLGQYLVGQLQ